MRSIITVTLLPTVSGRSFVKFHMHLVFLLLTVTLNDFVILLHYIAIP